MVSLTKTVTGLMATSIVLPGLLVILPMRLQKRSSLDFAAIIMMLLILSSLPSMIGCIAIAWKSVRRTKCIGLIQPVRNASRVVAFGLNMKVAIP